MSRLQRILVLVVISGTISTTSCSQDSHGSYSHFLDEKSYIYRSAIGVPNTGDIDFNNKPENFESKSEKRSLDPETGFQSHNKSNYLANLYYSPYAGYPSYNPDLQQEIYKRNAFPAPDLNGPPAPLGIPPGLHHNYNYGGHANPYISGHPSLPSLPSLRSSPYVTNIHYPPVYVPPHTSPAPIYRYSPTPVPYTTPVPAYRFSQPSHGISPTPPHLPRTPVPVYVPPTNSYDLARQPLHHRLDPLPTIKSLPPQEAVTPSALQFREPRPLPIPTFSPNLSPTTPLQPPPYPTSHHFPSAPSHLPPPAPSHHPPSPPPPPPPPSHLPTTPPPSPPQPPSHLPPTPSSYLPPPPLSYLPSHPPPTPPPPPHPPVPSSLLNKQTFPPQNLANSQTHLHDQNHIDSPSPLIIRNPSLLPKLTRFGNSAAPQHGISPSQHLDNEILDHPQVFKNTDFSKGSHTAISSPLKSPESIFLPQQPNKLSGAFEDVQRPPRKRSRALDKLLDVAGESWDSEVDIQTNLISELKVADFICPSREGYFPDTASCNSYFQCDHGVALKQSCQTGLVWNMLIEQCDWDSNVNCEQNKSFRHYKY